MSTIIILDTNAVVSVFSKMATELGEQPEFVVNVIQELLDRMEDRSKTELLIRGFIANIKSGKYLDRENGYDEIESFYADIISEVASEILSQLDLLRIYGSDGKLDFVYYIADTPSYSTDVMLFRNTQA